MLSLVEKKWNDLWWWWMRTITVQKNTKCTRKKTVVCPFRKSTNFHTLCDHCHSWSFHFPHFHLHTSKHDTSSSKARLFQIRIVPLLNRNAEVLMNCWCNWKSHWCMYSYYTLDQSKATYTCKLNHGYYERVQKARFFDKCSRCI